MHRDESLAPTADRAHRVVPGRREVGRIDAKAKHVGPLRPGGEHQVGACPVIDDLLGVGFEQHPDARLARGTQQGLGVDEELGHIVRPADVASPP